MGETSSIKQVWQLYDLRDELIKALDKRSWTKDFKKYMNQKVRKVSQLLTSVRSCCSGYIGGEDVLLAIEVIKADVKQRIGDM